MSIYNINGAELGNAFNTSGDALVYAYDIDGDRVFPNGYIPSLTLLNSVLMSSLNPSIAVSPQGLAIFGDYYFQFFTGDNKMRIFNKNTHALVTEYSATDIKHANTMQFGDTVQDTGFPLLYVSEWGESGDSDSKVIDVLKVSLNGYQKIRYFTLPLSVGNHPSFIADWENDTAYTIGYSGGTRDSEYMIISVFDVNDMTTPISQYQVPYIGVLNGFEYYNNQLIFYGNAWDSSTLTVSFVDVETHDAIQYTFDKTTDEEYEDCCVVGDNLFISNWTNDGNLKYELFSMNLT